MPHYREWVQRGYFLDLRDIEEDRRPGGRASRFWRVEQQRITNVRPIRAGQQLSPGSEIEFDIDTQNSSDVLELDSRQMIMQCALGLKNDFRAWMEHPSDYSMRRVPQEVPTANEEVGIIGPDDSPYYEPNLDETEFWIVKDIADEPSVHASKVSGGTIEPVVSVKANKMILEPVETQQTVNKLESYQLPSTPVNLKVEV